VCVGACTSGCKAVSSRYRPHALAFLVGDAALTVHYWPSRGLNSRLKMAVACVDVIANAIQQKCVVPLTPSNFSKYNEYLRRLERREHDERSMFVVKQGT
jgi:2-polyprenyl-6-methoxyphenol hydroxylase-like FAD-dependent oxidoreductase